MVGPTAMQEQIAQELLGAVCIKLGQRPSLDFNTDFAEQGDAKVIHALFNLYNAMIRVCDKTVFRRLIGREEHKNFSVDPSFNSMNQAGKAIILRLAEMSIYAVGWEADLFRYAGFRLQGSASPQLFRLLDTTNANQSTFRQ